LTVPHFAVLVVGVEHLLAASRGERVGVEADGDAAAGNDNRMGVKTRVALFISFESGL